MNMIVQYDPETKQQSIRVWNVLCFAVRRYPLKVRRKSQQKE